MPEVVENHGAEVFFSNLFEGVRMRKITLNVTTAKHFLNLNVA